MTKVGEKNTEHEYKSADEKKANAAKAQPVKDSKSADEKK